MSGTLLGNDLVINETDCNLSCAYCLTGQSNLKRSHREQLIFAPPQRGCYSASTPLGQRIDTVIERIATEFGTPLLKITGGEVFLVQNVLDLVEAAAQRFASVVVQTNAALLRPEHLRRLAQHSNVTLQISLDSHLFEGNSFRVPRGDLHDKIIARIAAAIEAGLPLEVYAVVHSRSAQHLVAFAAWLDRFGTELRFLPFPVRGPDSAHFACRPDQIGHVEALAAAFERFARILPPKAYLDRLVRFLHDGGRSARCHLPRLVVSSFSDGTITACPNIWFSELGNAAGDGWQAALARVGRAPLYRALLAPRPRLAACRGCFTPWDLLSLYFDDDISLDELCASPPYRPAAVRERIAGIKAEHVAEHAA
ncbi:radical SAM protein [Blastochloris viridis]|uniref:Molybdenum cofactor biosynthesis protein A n=1 Tax=Blastochloris viridis TaxID=1079 RepID=A0A0H5B8R4_BLAVI|nr:radical SAM protein [Blastochloris viridis]ALK08134.1 Antilisterial bacteriocin subtilosin biosynthesis protein AlbA [Blastochloris viridis]BAR98600.1 hypothetical protein BV133_1007 [Blastochloris viridis]CUU44056.1 molybdenum cofactor biosynthesis protein A [Blastochloris viridis]